VITGPQLGIHGYFWVPLLTPACAGLIELKSVHACRTHETHNRISYASLCARLLSVFWRNYSEFATNVQRTASALDVCRARILSVCFANMLK